MTPKCGQVEKGLQKYFLRQVIGSGRIVRHMPTPRLHGVFVLSIQLFPCKLVAPA
jgi:hypothetical protein